LFFYGIFEAISKIPLAALCAFFIHASLLHPPMRTPHTLRKAPHLDGKSTKRRLIRIFEIASRQNT
jgi:hypothetical protein